MQMFWGGIPCFLSFEFIKVGQEGVSEDSMCFKGWVYIEDLMCFKEIT